MQLLVFILTTAGSMFHLCSAWCWRSEASEQRNWGGFRSFGESPLLSQAAIDRFRKHCISAQTLDCVCNLLPFSAFGA